MPMIDGKPVRARFTSLKINELSSVDRPAQPGARMVFMKRDDTNDQSKAREDTMKTVAELEGELAKRDDTIKALTADLAKAKVDFAAMAEEKDKAAEDCKTAKAELAKATDEVLKVEGIEVRKSEVGEAQFSLTKALIGKAETAEFENVAKTAYPNLVGTVAEKALVLKSIAAMPEEAKKAAEAIMTSAEKMLSAGFARLGTGHGAPISVTAKAAQDGFMTKVSEIEKRDNISHTAALSKARVEAPEEFAAFNGN